LVSNPITPHLQIEVKVTPNSSKARIVRDSSKRLKIFVHSPREKGKANDELFEVFETFFKPIKFQMEIIHGALQPIKILRFTFPSVEQYHLFFEKLGSL
jgi:uncharacterized protein (TIGR00251 family)